MDIICKRKLDNKVDLPLQMVTNFNRFITNSKVDWLLKRRYQNHIGIKHGANNVNLALKNRFSLNIKIPSLSVEKKYFELQKCANAEMINENIDYTHLHYIEGNYIVNKIFQHPDEYLYKEFLASIGHLKGQSESIDIVLSSHAFYVLYPNTAKVKIRIAYENISAIIVGSFERWLAIKRNPLSCDDSNLKDYYIQFEMALPNLMLDFIKFFELAIRRRLQILILKEKCKANFMGLDLNILQPNNAFKKGRFKSIGRLIDHLTPSVTSFFPVELEYIERILIDQQTFTCNKVQKCWLVYWENGSISVTNETNNMVLVPQLEEHLMIHLHSLKTWVPAYFILKGNILYQFTEYSDSIPQSIIDIFNCCGCSRVISDTRPYGFQVIRDKEEPILLAAPNERIASQWLQAILKILCSKVKQEEKRKYLSCQLIQTSSGLALTHQEDFGQLTYITSSVQKISSEKHLNSLKSDLSNLSIEGTSKICKHLNLTVKHEKLLNLKSAENIKNELIEGNEQSEKEYTKMHESISLSCPPTPPLLHIPSNPVKEPPDAVQSNKNEQMKNKDSYLQILSAVDYSQISEILVDEKAKAIFVEFECNEASELAIDWFLYFPSETHLQSFLDIVKNNSENKCEILFKYSDSGHISNILQGGALDIYRKNFSSVFDSSVPVLLDRLRGLCDGADMQPEVFQDHEVVFVLKDFTAAPTPGPQTQGVILRVRRALNRPNLPYMLRYTGQPEIGNRPAILRNCLDVPVSQNICDFLQELGAKVDHEFISKGYILRKGRMKITVFKMYKIGNQNGHGASKENLEPLSQSHLVEVSITTTRTDEAVADEIRSFADQLKPLVQLDKLDYRRTAM